MREDGGLCNSLHPLDIPGAVHVKASEPEEDEAQDDSRKDHPGTDRKNDGQDADNCQTNLQ